MNNYYERLKRDFKRCPEILKEVELLYNYKENFKYFYAGIFNEDNIKIYGEEALYNAMSNYKYDLIKKSENPEKLKVLLTKLPEISDKFYTNKNVSIEDLKELTKHHDNIDLINLIRYCSDDKDIENFIKVIKNEEKFENLLYVINYFNIGNFNNELYTMISEEKFNQFIKIIDKRYITSYTSFSQFKSMFEKNKSLFDKEYNEEEIRIINDYMFNMENLSFTLSKNDLKKYYDDREHSALCHINFMYGSALKDYLSEIYFGRRFENAKNILIDTKNVLRKEGLLNEQYNDLFKFISIEDKEELKKFVKNIKFEFNIAGNLLDRSKSLSKKQLKNEVQKINIIKASEILKLKGEDFYLLAHKIKGFNNGNLANELHQDPSNWTKHYEKNSYISTSAINQNHLGLVEDDGYIMGFKNIDESDILAMGPKDILTDKKLVKSGIDNNLIRYMEPNDLIFNSDEIYNEIVLKRYRDKEPVMPDCLITIDNTLNRDKEISKYFDIPVVEIESQIYVDKLIEKFNFYVKNEEYYKAANALRNLTTGFITFRYARDKYLNEEALQEEINYICYSFNGKNKEELKYLVKVFNEITRFVSKYNNHYFILNTEDLVSKAL